MKAPYKVLFSNDCTNIECCVSPYHKKGEHFKPEMLKASVAETAGQGIDVHMLQPGLCNAPWWQSKINPPAKHYEWIEKVYGSKIAWNGYSEYLKKGGDIVEDFIRHCHEYEMASFISIRMNDGHHKQFVDDDKLNDATKKYITPEAFDKFYYDHPEYRIGQCLRRWDLRVLNWAIPEVRQHKFELLEELCENYELDGLELDLMRFNGFFNVYETTEEYRSSIMSDFMKSVRLLLDRTSRNGRRRWLCVRIPYISDEFPRLGIDVASFAESGVDMFNLSNSYLTDQQNDLSAVRSLAPNASIYLEMNHSTSLGQVATNEVYDGDNYTFRRTTNEQFETTANLAYSKGADGVSLFNFVYYREHGEGSARGPFCAPPFGVIKGLSNPGWLAKRPQHYFMGYAWESWSKRQLPKAILLNGQWLRFRMDMAPNSDFKGIGKLRVHTLEPVAGMAIDMSINGHFLKEQSDVSCHYTNEYPGLDRALQTLAWDVPSEVIRMGENILEGRYVGKKTITITFIDLTIG